MRKAKDLDRILADLVAFRTVSGELQTASACLDYVEDYLSECGMAVRRLESRGFPSLVATTRPTKTPKVLLQAHIDVVAAPDSCFKLHGKEGKLLGRGVFDMKFAPAVFMKVADSLRGRLADYDFGIMLTSDEEIGGVDGVKAMLEAGYRTAVCILPDAGDNWHIETSHKGAWIGRLTTEGIAAHGSRPWEGDNAIDRLVDALCDIRELFDGQHTDSDTLSINKIYGGAVTNQVADRAEASLDMRTVSNDSFDKLQKRMRAIARQYDASLETITHVPVSQTDITHPLVASFLDIASKLHGNSLKPVRSLGTSDAYYFAGLGMPVIQVRPEGGCAHGDEEWIGEDGLEEYYQVIKAYVEATAFSGR